MGLALPYSSSIPAEEAGKADECRRAGAAIRTLLERDLKPLDILSRKSLENALVMIMAVGGSTNAVLHLMAIAKTARIPLALDDFQKISDRVPLLADFKPSGRYAQEDLHNIGGTPALMKYLLARGFLHGDCMTVTGGTLEQNLPPRSPQARRSFTRSKLRSSRAATCASFAAIWHPTAP
jgi:dihydroxy-acid dehydratase